MDSSWLKIVLGLSIFSILLSIGLGLSIEDFKRVVTHPKAFFVALGAQLLLLPGLAVVVAILFQLDGIAALGLLLLAACPGGVTSNLFTRLSGGSTVLSVSLTAVNSLLAVVSIPAVLYFGQLLLGDKAMVVTIPFDFLLQQLLVITFVPVTLGMLIKHYASTNALRLEKVLFPLTSAMFFVLIFSVWYTEYETYRDAFISAGAPAITLFLATCIFAVVIARLSGLQRRDRIAMVYEIGVQNPPVAFFIAATVLGNMELLPPSAVYAVIMVIMSIVFVPFMRRVPGFP